MSMFLFLWQPINSLTLSIIAFCLWISLDAHLQLKFTPPLYVPFVCMTMIIMLTGYLYEFWWYF